MIRSGKKKSSEKMGGFFDILKSNETTSDFTEKEIRQRDDSKRLVGGLDCREKKKV